MIGAWLVAMLAVLMPVDDLDARLDQDLKVRLNGRAGGLAGEWNGTWVFPIPGEVFPCGARTALSWSRGYGRVVLWGPDSEESDLPTPDQFLAGARAGSHAWFVALKSPYEDYMDNDDYDDVPLRLVHVDCSSDTPILDSAMLEVPGARYRDPQRTELLLPDGKPWVARRSEEKGSQWEIAIMSTGAIHKVQGTRFEAMRHIEQVVVYRTVDDRAMLRDLELPVAVLFADGRTRELGPTDACRDVVASFGAYSRSSSPVLYHATADGARWNIEAVHPADTDQWTVTACVVHWSGEQEIVEGWATQGAFGDAHDINFWPIDRQRAWISTYLDDDLHIYLFDVEKRSLTPHLPTEDWPRYSNAGLIPFGEHGAILRNGDDLAELALPGESARDPMTGFPSNIQAAWRFDGQVWGVSDEGEIGRAKQDPYEEWRKLSPCYDVDEQPSLTAVQLGHGWGSCGDQGSFGFVDTLESDVGDHFRVLMQSDSFSLDTGLPLPASLPCSAFDGDFTIQVFVPNSGSEEDGMIQFAVISGTDGDLISDKRAAERDGRPLENNRCVPGARNSLSWRYTDRNGSNVALNWEGIELTGPLWSRSDIVTPIAAGLSVVFAGLWLFLGLLPGLLRGGGFLVLLGVGGALPFFVTFPPLTFAYDPWLGLALYLVGVGLIALMCMAIPTLFWRMASAPPVSLAARPMLRFTGLRRRMFGAVARATRVAATERLRGQFGDRYYAMPVNLIRPGETLPVQIPIDLLRAHIDATAGGGVLIEGESGTGKTFLLRQVVLDACDRFARGESSRLPLLLAQPRGRAADPTASPRSALARLAIESLGSHGVARDIAVAVVRQGAMLLCVDGLTEGDLESVQIQAARDELTGTCLVATARPSRGLRDVFADSSSLVVETQSLSDHNLDPFCRAISEHTLPPELRDLIRGVDGGYRPILVVIALSVGDAAVTGIAGIFERCFLQMAGGVVGPAGALAVTQFDEALSLCLRTFWRDGERTFAPTFEAEACIRGLLDANILHPVGAAMWRRGASMLPRRVRFFHDLMQTYLTARGLIREFSADARRRQEVLLIGASHPHFGARGGAGDLFQAWVGSLDPELLGQDLDAILDAWIAGGDRIDECVLKGVVLAALPPDSQQQVRDETAGGGTVAALRVAARSSTGDIAARVRLVGQVAPSVMEAGLYSPVALRSRRGELLSPLLALVGLLVEVCGEQDGPLRQCLIEWPLGHQASFAAHLPGAGTSAIKLADDACQWLVQTALTRQFCEYLVHRAPARYGRDIQFLADAMASHGRPPVPRPPAPWSRPPAST